MIRLLLKQLLCKLHLAAMVGMIEFCAKCGIRQPIVWRASNDLWFVVTGKAEGVLCPKCFTDRARALHLLLEWEPSIDQPAGKE